VNEIDAGYNPRKIMRMILLEQKDETLGSKELWKCNQCHACVSHCPQDVRFADVVRALRDLAVEQGYADKDLPGKVAEEDLKARKQRLNRVKALIK